MGKRIVIDGDSCTKCGRCVRVCPAKIMTQESAVSAVDLVGVNSCISCGHCVAACPTGSVIHSEFPVEKVHKIDYAQMPTPEQVMQLCRVRRSNRAFSSKQIPAESLDLILEAAHRAPTGSNAQQVSYTVITDRQKLDLVIDFTLGVFDGIAKKLENPLLKPLLRRMMPGVYAYLPNFKRMVEERREGKDPILRGASAVIFIHTPSQSRLGNIDANLAYQNGSLMAESLGVSQVYTGFVLMAIKQDNKNALAKALGIEGTIHAGMALGMPAFRFPNYIDKKEIEVDWIK